MIDLQDVEERLAIRLDGTGITACVIVRETPAGTVAYIDLGGEPHPVHGLGDVDRAIDRHRAAEELL